jgi:hypothetical protein
VSDAPAQAVCPRCGARFHCGAGDRRPCACAALTLDADLRAALCERFDGCLCPACLSRLAAEHQTRKQ